MPLFRKRDPALEEFEKQSVLRQLKLVSGDSFGDRLLPLDLLDIEEEISIPISLAELAENEKEKENAT